MAAARTDAQSIERDVSRGLDQIPNLQDRTPWWGHLLTWGLIALSLGGVIYLLTATGLWALVRSAVAVVISFIPTPATRRAAMDAEALARGQATPATREAIAASRAADPIYDAAFRRTRRRQQRQIETQNPEPETSNTEPTP